MSTSLLAKDDDVPPLGRYDCRYEVTQKRSRNPTFLAGDKATEDAKLDVAHRKKHNLHLCPRMVATMRKQ